MYLHTRWPLSLGNAVGRLLLPLDDERHILRTRAHQLRTQLLVAWVELTTFRKVTNGVNVTTEGVPEIADPEMQHGVGSQQQHPLIELDRR